MANEYRQKPEFTPYAAMSVRSDKPKPDVNDAAAILSEAVTTDTALGEGNSYCVASPVRDQQASPLQCCRQLV